MPRFLRRFLSIFILNREERHRFANTWGRTRNFGKNNRIIYVDPDGTEREVSASSVVPGVNLVFEGNNNVLRLHKPFHFEYCDMTLRENETAEFQATRYRIGRANFCLSPGKSCKLTVGKDFSCMGGFQIAGFDEDCLSVTIGEDCMFSYGVAIRASDGHTLLDAQTKKVLNPGQDIYIGNHVWAGMHTCFLKGARVPDDCVVGAQSIVTRAFTQPNRILVGSPARELKDKQPITWDRRPVTAYLLETKSQTDSLQH